MSVSSFKDLIQHFGHKIVCVTYGDPPVNVALECETCSEVLLDFDAPMSVIAKHYKYKGINPRRKRNPRGKAEDLKTEVFRLEPKIDLLHEVLGFGQFAGIIRTSDGFFLGMARGDIGYNHFLGEPSSAALARTKKVVQKLSPGNRAIAISRLTQFGLWPLKNPRGETKQYKTTSFTIELYGRTAAKGLTPKVGTQTIQATSWQDFETRVLPNIFASDARIQLADVWGPSTVGYWKPRAKRRYWRREFQRR